MAEVFMSAAGIGNGFEDKTQYQLRQINVNSKNTEFTAWTNIAWDYVLIFVIDKQFASARPVPYSRISGLVNLSVPLYTVDTYFNYIMTMTPSSTSLNFTATSTYSSNSYVTFYIPVT